MRAPARDRGKADRPPGGRVPTDSATNPAIASDFFLRVYDDRRRIGLVHDRGRNQAGRERGIMARRRATPRLTAGEMEIMAMLWEHTELTLSEAHQALGRPIGYTTMQTRLNRLVAKRVLTRSEGRPARYAAAVSAEAVGTRHLDLLVERIRGFKIVPLVAHLVRDRRLTAEEIRELKRLIEQAEALSRGRGGEAKS
jgi:BlaI family transcriptional regulator, penicillinase repressor